MFNPSSPNKCSLCGERNYFSDLSWITFKPECCSPISFATGSPLQEKRYTLCPLCQKRITEKFPLKGFVKKVTEEWIELD
mgnify:CR=1 FL=1